MEDSRGQEGMDQSGSRRRLSASDDRPCSGNVQDLSSMFVRFGVEKFAEDGVAVSQPPESPSLPGSTEGSTLREDQRI